jgi:hypothetical protein
MCDKGHHIGEKRQNTASAGRRRVRLKTAGGSVYRKVGDWAAVGKRKRLVDGKSLTKKVAVFVAEVAVENSNQLIRIRLHLLPEQRIVDDMVQFRDAIVGARHIKLNRSRRLLRTFFCILSRRDALRHARETFRIGELGRRQIRTRSSIDGYFDAVEIVGRKHDLMHDDATVEKRYTAAAAIIPRQAEFCAVEVRLIAGKECGVFRRILNFNNVVVRCGGLENQRSLRGFCGIGVDRRSNRLRHFGRRPWRSERSPLRQGGTDHTCIDQDRRGYSH